MCHSMFIPLFVVAYFLIIDGKSVPPSSLVEETVSRILKPRLLNRTSAFPLPDQPVTVSLAFMLDIINDVNIASQMVTLTGLARMRWTQETVSWSASANSGVDKLYMEDIWIPPVTIPTRGSSCTILSTSPVLVSSDGKCEVWVKLRLQLFIPDLTNRNKLKISWSLGFTPPYASQIKLSYSDDGFLLIRKDQMNKVSPNWVIVQTWEYASKENTFFYSILIHERNSERLEILVSMMIVGFACFLMYTIDVDKSSRYFFAVLCFTAMHVIDHNYHIGRFKVDWEILWLMSVITSAILCLLSQRDLRLCRASAGSVPCTSMTSRPSADLMTSSIQSSCASSGVGKSPSEIQLEQGQYPDVKVPKIKPWTVVIKIVDKIIAVLIFVLYVLICVRHMYFY